MIIPPVEYLSWHKNRPRLRFDLAVSGVPNADVAELIGDPRAFRAEMDQCAGYGHPALIVAVARRYAVPAENVLVTAGTSMANFFALACTAEPGRKVLLETPTYEPLLSAARLIGAERVRFERRPDARGLPGQPDQSAVEHGLRGGATAVVLSNHHNPGGVRLSAPELAPLIRLCETHAAHLIVDEAYLDLGYLNRGDPLWTAAALSDRVLATGSLTKAYGLSGLRIGWLLAAPEVIARARNLVDHLHVVDSGPSQVMGLRALRRIEVFEERCRAHYRACRPVLDEWLRGRPDVTANRDDGAVFALLRIEGVQDTALLAELLAREYETLVTPGHFFDGPRYLRIGFGGSAEELAEALHRMGRAVDRLRAAG